MADCLNCGDSSGWQFVEPYGWVACADCNDGMEKPKPEICYRCDLTKPFCFCDKDD